MFPVHKFVIIQSLLNVMKIARYVTWDFMEPVGMEIIANQMMHLALMLAVLQCHLYVMPTVPYVTMEMICMDAGWEISVSQMIYLVHMYVLLICLHNVMQIVRYVTWDFMEPVGMEIIAIQMMHL